jgi:hypothetical protein
MKAVRFHANRYVVRLSLNVSRLEQTVRFLPNKLELFPSYAPSALAGELVTRIEFDLSRW